MKHVTYNGPAKRLRVPGSDRILFRGRRGEVTNDEADRLAKSDHGVTVHRDQQAGDPEQG